MNLLLRFPSFVTRFTRIFIAFALGFLLSISPVLAQANANKAPILLDNRQLFRVSSSQELTAQERANYVNQVLEDTTETATTPVSIEVEKVNNIPVIRLDGKHLLSVTEKDAPNGKTREEQAEIWAGQLEKAIERVKRERTSGYFVQAVLLSIGYMLLAITLIWGLGKIWCRWLKPWLEKDTETTESQPIQNAQKPVSAEIGAQIILTLLRAVILLFTLIYISDLFPQTRRISRGFANALINSLTSELFPLGDNSYSLLDLIILIGLFAGLIIAARTVRQVLRTRILSITGLSRAAQETIALIANYAFVFIGTIVLLQMWGLDLSSLTVFAGVLGVGIGLGLQGIAKEFISGLVLIFERPIQVGDFVEVGDLVGTVEHISVRSTEIRTIDQVSIILPNSRFLETEVINWSHRSPVSRLKIPVGVAYGSNLTTVRTALIDAAKAHADVLSDPPPRVFFTGFGDSSLDFNLLVWISEPRKQFQIKSDLYFRIEAILRNRHVEIPFPQRDLHVRSGNLPVTLSPQLVDSLTHLSNNLAAWLKHQSNGGTLVDREREKNSEVTKTER